MCMWRAAGVLRGTAVSTRTHARRAHVHAEDQQPVKPVYVVARRKNHPRGGVSCGDDIPATGRRAVIILGGKGTAADKDSTR